MFMERIPVKQNDLISRFVGNTAFVGGKQWPRGLRGEDSAISKLTQNLYKRHFQLCGLY